MSIGLSVCLSVLSHCFFLHFELFEGRYKYFMDVATPAQSPAIGVAVYAALFFPTANNKIVMAKQKTNANTPLCSFLFEYSVHTRHKSDVVGDDRQSLGDDQQSYRPLLSDSR